MKKLEMMLEDESNMLHRCAYCNQLFNMGHREWMVCSKAKIFIDFHGNVIAQHVADQQWDINKFIAYMRNSHNLNWKDIYWKIFARTLKF